MTPVLKDNPYWEILKTRLASHQGLEEKLDEIRNFKREQIKPLREKFLKDEIPLLDLMVALTQLADAVLVDAYEMAVDSLRPTLGLPRFKDNDGNYLSGDFAIIGMGKLGGKELHFGSDLDIICIYNRNGETIGPKPVTNREYFAKLTQRIINYLTLHTSRGYAYHVDTELRPSGRAGALVTPIDSWTSYYHEMGQIWERQALLKARLIYASGDFSKDFSGLFKRLIFLKPFPENFAKDIHFLRMRMEKELAKESLHRWHFKKGYGGLVDIEFLVQYLQLKLGKVFEDLLTPNTLIALEKISLRNLLGSEHISLLKASYEFYRRIEFHLFIQPEWDQGYLDPRGETASGLAKKMGFKNKQDFMDKFAYYRNGVRKIYLDTLKVQGSPHDA